MMANQAGGVFRVGEKGIPDYLFAYYFQLRKPGAALLMWIETKREGEELRPEQIKWQLEETARGALIQTVDKFEPFREWYEQQFSWLHRSGGIAEGQLLLRSPEEN